jgi:hypothetical protein
MSEETTKSFNGEESFEARVLRELVAINSRLSALEDKVEARLHDTRPIWESVLSRITMIGSKMDVLAQDMLDVRAHIELLNRRVPPAA